MVGNETQKKVSENGNLIKYHCKNLNRDFELQEPCLERMYKLEKLGFDFEDIAKVNKAYLDCTRKSNELKELANILFDVELKNDEIKILSTRIIKDGLFDFLTIYGLLLK